VAGRQAHGTPAVRKLNAMEIRELTTLAEFADAVKLQRVIWNWDDIDILPVRFFVVARNIGGQALGAFEGNAMIGFCLAIPALKPGGETYLHSHMLGVLKEYRDTGVGRQLKFAQRDAALARGIDFIEWTFDPLEIKNAFFNIERLGAIVRRFVLNQYGITSSPLTGGLPTDRCVAEWHIRENRPGAPVTARISVPASIARIRQEDPERARRIQSAIADDFLDCFARNLVVTGFEITPDAGTYLLSPWPAE
jgi:predicted GNAT superfamily acetyltransferase